MPLSLGVAIYLTEFAPAVIRRPIAFVVELLAAIPSVVYGLWGIFVLIPLRTNRCFPFSETRLGFLPSSRAPSTGRRCSRPSIILAIMVMPYIMSVSREVLVAVPSSQREAALALGATRWEAAWTARGALCPLRDRRRDDPRAGPGAGRDDGGDHADRKPARDRDVAVRAGIHHGGRHRQRVLRGLETCTSRRWPTSRWCCSSSRCW